MNIENMYKGLIFILIGATLQNIIWYIRLQNTVLLGEFKTYWIKDGAKVFLDFNIMNYFFLFLAIFLYFMILLINKRRDAKRGKAE